MARNRKNEEISTKSMFNISALLLIGIVLLLISGVLPAENFIGMVIVLAIGLLLIFLLVMASAFARLSLTDPKQALGLPEGSIRALIALILLMVFIIVGIYLFRTVSYGTIYRLSGLTAAEVIDLGTRVINTHQNQSGTYDVVLQSTITDEGTRLAQQLITTIGTLVVAVAGFYFGTSSVSAARGVSSSLVPLLRAVDPDRGYAGQTVSLKITGSNFRTPKLVQLVRDANKIVGTSILSSDTEIRCTIQIPADTEVETKWDIQVVNEAGEEGMIGEAFMVIAPPVDSAATPTTINEQPAG